MALKQCFNCDKKHNYQQTCDLYTLYMKREHFKTSLKDCNVNTNQVWLNVVVVHRILAIREYIFMSYTISLGAMY